MDSEVAIGMTNLIASVKSPMITYLLFIFASLIPVILVYLAIKVTWNHLNKFTGSGSADLHSPNIMNLSMGNYHGSAREEYDAGWGEYLSRGLYNSSNGVYYSDEVGWVRPNDPGRLYTYGKAEGMNHEDILKEIDKIQSK